MTASRVCRVLVFFRPSFDYKKNPRHDSEVSGALKDLAENYKRFEHPSLFVLIKRDKGIHVNHKRIDRIYQAEKLQIKNERVRSLEVGREK